MSHAATVERIYQAFGRGDVSTILECLADDVEWEYGVNSTDVPWLQPRRGRADAANFFDALGEFRITKFEPTMLLEGDGVVVALIDLAGTVSATGRPIEEVDEAHVWRFNAEGRVSRFRHRTDTHQHWAARQPL